MSTSVSIFVSKATVLKRLCVNSNGTGRRGHGKGRARSLTPIAGCGGQPFGKPPRPFEEPAEVALVSGVEHDYLKRSFPARIALFAP